MPDKAIHLLVVEGFADWEPAHAVAELRRNGAFRIESVGLTSAPVRSMGGITVLPSKTIAEVVAGDVAAFILPGGDRWEGAPVEPELETLLRRLDAADVPIGAICGATVAIAQLGLLRGRRHTSNGLEYLRTHVPGYADAERYVDAPAVRDRKLITASGLADVEFARELLAELDVLSAEDRALWAQIFRSATLPRDAARERIFVVLRARGQAWDDSKPLEGQAEWEAHAAFMDRLFEERFAALVGPLEGTREALLVLRAASESEIRTRLDSDPWTRNGLLVTKQVSPWQLRLGSVA